MQMSPRATKRGLRFLYCVLIYYEITRSNQTGRGYKEHLFSQHFSLIYTWSECFSQGTGELVTKQEFGTLHSVLSVIQGLPRISCVTLDIISLSLKFSIIMWNNNSYSLMYYEYKWVNVHKVYSMVSSAVQILGKQEVIASGEL